MVVCKNGCTYEDSGVKDSMVYT